MPYDGMGLPGHWPMNHSGRLGKNSSLCLANSDLGCQIDPLCFDFATFQPFVLLYPHNSHLADLNSGSAPYVASWFFLRWPTVPAQMCCLLATNVKPFQMHLPSLKPATVARIHCWGARPTELAAQKVYSPELALELAQLPHWVPLVLRAH